MLDAADLLHELALVIPILPGARCKGQSRLYDRTIGRGLYDSPKITELARTQALQTCACCPALSACRQWFDGLPGDQRPSGMAYGDIRPIDLSCGSYRPGRRRAQVGLPRDGQRPLVRVA